MTTKIIAGRFQQQDEIEAAIDALRHAGFTPDQISSFYVNPAGQHDLYPVGGDRDKSPGAQDSSKGTMTGGAIGAGLGVAAVPLVGPLGPLVGAHIGSLVGTLSSMDDNGSQRAAGTAPMRKSGMMVAAGAATEEQAARALEVLRGLGATDIEYTDGTIVDGDWRDFDPLSPPALVQRAPQRPM